MILFLCRLRAANSARFFQRDKKIMRRGDPCGRPRAGKSPKRRRWRKKRGDFEEVPRLAATTVAGNRLAQRWAREPRPYAPSRTHCTGRTESSAPTSNSVGAGVPDGPPHALLAMCHCEASAHTGCGNPSPVPSAPLPKGGWHGEAVTGGFLTSPHLL